MAILSFVLSILSLFGYIIFLFGGASAGWIFFSSITIGIISVTLGFIAKGKPWARAGIILGIIDTAIGIALWLWFTLQMN